MTKYLMVGLGGALGSILRFWASGIVSNRLGGRFPYGTFVVNCTGSFLIGLIVTLLAERTHWSPNWRYLIPIGFIGGYTTFSAFELETLRSFQAVSYTHLDVYKRQVPVTINRGPRSLWSRSSTWTIRSASL